MPATLYPPHGSMNLVVRALYKLGGKGVFGKEGPDRRAILQEFIDELSLTLEQQKETVGTKSHPNRNKLSYTAIRGAEEGRLNYRGHPMYLRTDSPRGVWELTAEGMKYGQQLIEEERKRMSQ